MFTFEPYSCTVVGGLWGEHFNTFNSWITLYTVLITVSVTFMQANLFIAGFVTFCFLSKEPEGMSGFSGYFGQG
jgi:hypothetical protein